MITTSTDTQTQAQNHRFSVHHKLYWKGERYTAGDELTLGPSMLGREDVRAWIKHAWISELIDGQAPQTAKPARSKSADAKQREPSAKAAQPNPEAGHGSFELLDTCTIAPSPVNPRRHFDEEAMEELTESVREKGVRVAINVRAMPPGQWYVSPGRRSMGGRGMVEGYFLHDYRRFYTSKDSCGRPERNYHHLPPGLLENFFETAEEATAALPKWEIIAGERRWRAARRAGVATIRAVIEVMDDQEAAELQVIENDQRADLSPVETASGYQHLLSLPGYTMEKLEKKTGKKRNTLYSRLKLLELPENVQQAVARRELGTVTAERIGRLQGQLQIKAAEAILRPTGFREDDARTLSDREAKSAIERLQQEAAREESQRAAEAQMEAKGFQILRGAQAKGLLSYSDRVAHNAGYIDAREVCPHDPHRHTWAEIVEQSEQFMAENHLFVSRYAVMANSHQDGYKGVPVFARDQVNILLKALNLWKAEGSQKSREDQEREAAAQRAAQAREDMMRDIDAIADAARRERSPRNALLAAVWAATGDAADDVRVGFVIKRRAWISLDDEESDVCSVARSKATDLEIDDLQALVVELAIAELDDEESYFADGREEMRRLFDLEYSGLEESANARTEQAAELTEKLNTQESGD